MVLPPCRLLLCTITIFFLARPLVFAQKEARCHAHEYLEQRLANDPAFRRQFLEWSQPRSNKLNNRSALACNGSNSVVIPVAIHYNGNIDCSDTDCLTDAAEAQILAMNEAFSATNADLSGYTTDLNGACSTGYPLSTAPMQGQGTCIQFCLASKNHPASSGIAEGDPAITIRRHVWPSAGTDWAGYLNIFVSDAQPAGFSEGILGVSPVPGSANGDGFYVLAEVFGGPSFSCFSGVNINTNGNYDLGKTAIHEAGHYFGLHHTFRDSCNDGDKNPPIPSGFSLSVDDTPAEGDSYSGCPGNITNCTNAPKTCGGNSYTPFWNYMDYSYDDCMYMFSADQSAVINAWGNTLTWKSDATYCDSAAEFASLSCPCIISDVGLVRNACAGGTFTFSLNPTGSTLGATYSVSGDVSAAGLSYGSAILFDNGGAGFPIDGELSITISADDDPSCQAEARFYGPCVIENCATALEITPDDCYYAPGPTSGNGATQSAGTNHANWFKFEAPANGTIEVYSCGQLVDTRLWIYQGTCGGLTPVTNADDNCDWGDGNRNLASVATFSVSASTTYFIEWDDRWSPQGFSFYVIYQNNDNETCASAEDLPGTGLYLANGPNSGNGASTVAGLSPATHANWYTFTPTEDGLMDIFSCGGGADTRLKLFQGSCANLNYLTFSDDACDTGSGLLFASARTAIPISAGSTYYIEWDNRWSSFGFKFVLEEYQDCQDIIDLGTGSLSDPEYEAGIQLSSQNTIDSDVTFQSGSDIILGFPFEVLGGAAFQAYIGACLGLRVVEYKLRERSPVDKLRVRH